MLKSVNKMKLEDYYHLENLVSWAWEVSKVCTSPGAERNSYTRV